MIGARVRRGLVALAVVVPGGAIVLAGCSHTNSPPSTTGTSSTTTSAASSTTTSTTTSSTLCLASGLAASVVGSGGAAGTIELTFALRNTSSSACGLYGYPGAQLLDAQGSALATDVVRGGTYEFTDFAATSVTLAPGASAYFNLGYSDVTSGTTPCSSAASIEITPPNDVDHLDVTQSIQACSDGELTVSPVFGASSSETQTTAPAG